MRRLMLIPKTQNPKANALFLSALLKLSKIGVADHASVVSLMIESLIALRSRGVPYWCWGYSFLGGGGGCGQTRTVVVPAGAPNLVCTSFVVSALLDAYEQFQEPMYLSMAVSAAEYVLSELYWTDSSSVAGFSYPLPSLPGSNSQREFSRYSFVVPCVQAHGRREIPRSCP